METDYDLTILYYLKYIIQANNSPSIIIVGTHIDHYDFSEEKKQEVMNQMHKFRSIYPMIRNIIFISSETMSGKNVKKKNWK